MMIARVFLWCRWQDFGRFTEKVTIVGCKLLLKLKICTGVCDGRRCVAIGAVAVQPIARTGAGSAESQRRGRRQCDCFQWHCALGTVPITNTIATAAAAGTVVRRERTSRTGCIGWE